MGTDHGGQSNGSQHLGRLLLMHWIALGMQKHHSCLADALSNQGFELFQKGVIPIQWIQLMASRIQPARHLEHGLRQERSNGLPQGKQIRTVLIADPQQICQTGVGQQQQRLADTFQQGIGRHGRAQTKTIDGVGRHRLIGIKPKQLTNGKHRRIGAGRTGKTLVDVKPPLW